MSVVNRMLQDLDRRRASAAERGNLPQHLQMLPPPMRSLPRRALVLSAAVLASFLALGGVYAWEQSRRIEPASVAVPIALPISNAAAAVEAAAAPPKSLADEASPARPQPPRPPVQTTVAAQAKSLPTKESTPRDATPGYATLAASTVHAKPVAPPPEVSPRPSPKPATTSSTAGSAREASHATVSQSLPSKAKAAPDASQRADDATGDARVEKRVRSPSARERADGEYRRANAALAQGRAAEALPLLQQALREDATHVAARLALARLLAEAGDGREAADVLRAGAMDGAGNAEYRGLHAAVMQRLKRDAEAVQEYQAALRLMPGNAVWWMGLGLSLEALGNRGDARLSYLQAKSAGTLSGELADFVEQKLRQLP